jgi:hypothetical protein
MFRCDPSTDLPAPGKIKQIVFYAQGLKIYGVLPFILKRRLRAEFYSNYFVQTSGAFRGAGIIAPSFESNYTLIIYDQSPEAIAALLDWLFRDAGFEWGVAPAQEFRKDLRQGTAFCFGEEPILSPSVNTPEWRELFAEIMAGTIAISTSSFLGHETH